MGGWRLLVVEEVPIISFLGYSEKAKKMGYYLGYLNKTGRISGTRSATKSYLHLNSKRYPGFVYLGI